MAYVKRAAWVLVAAFALGLSWWSLAYVARSWGVPGPLSWVVSAVFDGVALICADLALRAARNGDSTFAPSTALVVFAGLSAWFNSQHAQLTGLGPAAQVFYACPPVAAVVVTELQLRHDRRAALRAAGRVADPLPVFGGAMWLHKPYSTYKGLRLVLRHRQAEQIRLATGPVPKTPAAGKPSPAGATARPREDRKQPAGGKRSKMDPERRAEVLSLMRADLAAGVELSKRTVPGRYGVTAYHGEQLLAEARQLVAV
jgi:hypothetical protein